MATIDSQQSWLPYDGSNKGCSHGFCSIYCPQWCYVLFPPPPPFSITGADDESGTALSPLVIAIISFLAIALLLVIYYIFVSKYRASLSFPRRPSSRLEEPAAAAFSSGGLPEERQASRSGGLEEALVNTAWRFKKGEALVVGTDCSVCLSEFREEESLRLLPKCSHAFHLQCIDTWLKSHPNCPLCRDNVMSATPSMPEPASNTATVAAAEREQEMETIVVVEDPERNEEGEDRVGGEGADQGMDIVEIGEEEDAELATSLQGRVSIAELLQESIEEENMEAKDSIVVEGGGPCRPAGEEVGGGGGRSRQLHCVFSPVRMKRYVLSGSRGRGRTSPLPV